MTATAHTHKGSCAPDMCGLCTFPFDAYQVAEDLGMSLIAASDEGELPFTATVESFNDAGVLTRDAGFVIRLDDGTEFQVTVVRSR